MIEFTDANWEAEVLKSDVPVLVDFWAPWCGPCRAITPLVEELAKAYAGKAKIGKLNIDENETTAGLYRVMSIPQLFVFKGGEPVGHIIGAQPKARIEAELKAHL